MKHCKNYVGVACVDGSCPMARQEEYEERCIPVIHKCEECFYDKGCEDCALYGTEYCDGDEKHGKSKAKVEVVMRLNTWANRCGYFYNAELDPDAPCAPNNGYNCRHPNCGEEEGGVGCCYAWACPLAYPADGVVCKQFGVGCEECGNETCECEDDMMVCEIPADKFDARFMWRKINGA